MTGRPRIKRPTCSCKDTSCAGPTPGTETLHSAPATVIEMSGPYARVRTEGGHDELLLPGRQIKLNACRPETRGRLTFRTDGASYGLWFFDVDGGAR
jgi:hypothetical protein